MAADLVPPSTIPNSASRAELDNRRSWLHRAWPWCAAALSGWLLTMCFPRWDQAWLCWIALAPLLCAIWFSPEPVRRRWMRDALLGYVAGLVFFTTVFMWLGTSLSALLQSVSLLAIPPLLGGYMGLYLAFWSWLVGTLPRGDTQFLSSRRNVWIAFIGACAWTAHEWVRGWMFTGFGWNGLGVALHKNLAMIQIADITGVAGLSFLTVFANIIAVITVRRFVAEIRRGRIRPHWDFSFTMLLIACVFSYGMHALMRLKKVEGIALRTTVVQANIPQNEKFDEAFEQQIFDKYSRLSLAAITLKSQLLVWPEAATPRGIFADEVNRKFAFDLAAQGGFNFLLGSIDSDLNEHDYNIAVMLTEGGKQFQVYHKIHLVPYGEFLPFRKSFPLIQKIAGDLVPSDFTPGSEPLVFQIENPALKIAPLICFEDTDGDLTRKFVLRGAQLLVNMTNDGWFLRSQAAEQHVANAVFRTVETRRPLLRSANTGVTCFVDSVGRVDVWLKPFTAGSQTREITVPTALTTTFYTRHGEVFAMACAAMTCGFLLVRRKFR